MLESSVKLLNNEEYESIYAIYKQINKKRHNFWKINNNNSNNNNK